MIKESYAELFDIARPPLPDAYERPAAHLKDFSGVLHADAYAGYDNLYISDKNPDATISEAACWAHTRRKFYEVTVANDKANIAISVLKQISEIYKIDTHG